MTRGARLIRAAFGAITVLVPAAAFAHAAEFILAKVEPAAGRVSVELAIDCAGHPTIQSEAEARAVLEGVLRVRAGEKVQTLQALAPLRFERRTQIDPDAPLPRDPDGGAEPHQIVCAVWSRKCSEDTVAFEVPVDAGQSVLLWTPAKSPGEDPRWVILIGGDVSPPITLPVAKLPFWQAGVMALGIASIVLPTFRWILRRNAQVSAFIQGRSRILPRYSGGV